MLTFQYTFEPTEEEFNLPSKAIDKGNKLGRKLQEIRNNQENIIGAICPKGLFTGDSGRTRVAYRVEMVYFNHPNWSGEAIFF